MNAPERPEPGKVDRGRNLRRWLGAYAGSVFCYGLIFGALIVGLHKGTPSRLIMVPLQAGAGFPIYALAASPIAVAATYLLRDQPYLSRRHVAIAGVIASCFATLLLMALDGGVSRLAGQLGEETAPLLFAAIAGAAAGLVFRWLWTLMSRAR